MVNLFKTLGDINRLRILNILMNHELCVCEIEIILEMTQSNVSRYLRKLKNAGIIESSKEAQWVYYKINNKFILEHKKLLSYLKENFSNDQLYIRDLKRYKKYKENNMNCQWISNNREKVIELTKLKN